MPKDGTVATNVRLPAATHARLKEWAWRERRTLNAQLVWALQHAMDDLEVEQGQEASA